MDLPGKHLLRLRSDVQRGMSAAVDVPGDDALSLSEAVAIYLRLKGAGRPVTFHRGAERSRGYVIEICGDKVITSYEPTPLSGPGSLLVHGRSLVH